MKTPLSRRNFLCYSAATGLGLTACAGVPQPRPGSGGVHTGGGSRLRVLSIGVVGTIGRKDRREIAGHPDAEIVGLCDVDANALANAAAEVPGAFTCRDYRAAFADHSDEFDAVIVSTPDHSHAPIMLTAFAHDKHVYGQKPLVHQLEELVMMERALAAKPDLVTQLGNQRMVYPGRRAAVEILRQGQLGKAIEAHVWVGSPNRGRYFNFDRVLHEPSPAPEHLDWDLWLGPCAEAPFREGLAPIVWRSWWEYGTNGLGDWGCHVLGRDPVRVRRPRVRRLRSRRTAPRAARTSTSTCIPCRARRSRTQVSVGLAQLRAAVLPDSTTAIRGQAPSRAALGLPADAWLENNCTARRLRGRCARARRRRPARDLARWQDDQGARAATTSPSSRKLNHWHAWVDNCMGRDTELRTPFRDAVRITEPALLAVKATCFPGQELRWDKSKLAFTNHEDATKQLVRRDYRQGFAPPHVG